MEVGTRGMRMRRVVLWRGCEKGGGLHSWVDRWQGLYDQGEGSGNFPKANVTLQCKGKGGSQMLHTVDYEYAIYPHKGDWVEGQVYAEADKLNAKPAATQI